MITGPVDAGGGGCTAGAPATVTVPAAGSFSSTGGAGLGWVFVGFEAGDERFGAGFEATRVGGRVARRRSWARVESAAVGRRVGGGEVAVAGSSLVGRRAGVSEALGGWLAAGLRLGAGAGVGADRQAEISSRLAMPKCQ